MKRALVTAVFGLVACTPPVSKSSRDAQGTTERDDSTERSSSNSDTRTASDDQRSPNAAMDETSASGVASDATGSFDLDVWARDHGVVVELKVDGCELARLGNKPEETLWCYRHEEQSGARVLYFRTLYALVAHRLVRVTELPTAAGPFASEGERAAPRTVELTAKVAGDGQSVSLEEVAGRTCDDARRANDKALEDEPLGGPGFLKLVDRVCSARGRYTWHSGALTKER